MYVLSIALAWAAAATPNPFVAAAPTAPSAAGSEAVAPAPPPPSPPAASINRPAEPGFRVARPGYDLGVSEITMDGRGTHYRLGPREWNQVVREDPELWALHRRGRAFVPGIVMSSVSFAWLAFSTAWTIDSGPAESATGRLFMWGLPAALAVSGVTLAIVGARARRKLDRRRRQLFVTPVAARGSAGLSFAGRF